MAEAARAWPEGAAALSALCSYLVRWERGVASQVERVAGVTLGGGRAEPEDGEVGADPTEQVEDVEGSGWLRVGAPGRDHEGGAARPGRDPLVGALAERGPGVEAPHTPQVSRVGGPESVQVDDRDSLDGVAGCRRLRRGGPWRGRRRAEEGDEVRTQRERASA